ncbi:MAG: hypothetical protein PHI32_14725 [Dysgonamonadaceae bacterium]|nr:hypothetical protein [Dysgonamonadaceae bacterium]MDD4727731.1 hypothetical protein [Dysgonamonadaceae bacterium]
MNLIIYLKHYKYEKTIVSIVLIVFAAISCSPLFYTPNTQNVPLFTHKGDNNIMVAGNGNQVELQGAYALTDAFAIQANGVGSFLERRIMEMEVQVNSLS